MFRKDEAAIIRNALSQRADRNQLSVGYDLGMGGNHQQMTQKTVAWCSKDSYNPCTKMLVITVSRWI